MQKTGVRFYSLFATILFLLPVVMRLFMNLSPVNSIYNIVFYAVYLLEVVLIGADVVRTPGYAKAFCFDNVFRLNVFSYLLATGFFIDFVVSVSQIINAFSGNMGINLIDFIPDCLCCILAFGCCLYFITVGLSFSGDNYDFRQFRYYHIVVLLWSIAKILTVLSEIINFTYDLNQVIKYFVLIFGACFFYCFVSETERQEGAKKITVFFARVYAYCAVFYFIDRVILLFNTDTGLTHPDNFFAITALFAGVFAFFFEKNIIYHKE